MSTPFDHIPSCSRTADYTKPTATAPVSRLKEVEAEIADLDDSYSARTYTDGYADLARTLAAEVDARDEVIGRLLAMLDPGSGQLGRIEDDKTISLTITEWNLLVTAHERACEIAGRTE